MTNYRPLEPSETIQVGDRYSNDWVSRPQGNLSVRATDSFLGKWIDLNSWPHHFFRRPENNKTTMKKYRELKDNETVQATDVYSFNGRGTDLENPYTGEGFLNRKQNEWTQHGSRWYRPIDDNWISFKDRKPTEADAYNGERGIAGSNYRGSILIMFDDGSMGLHPWNTYRVNDREHWMPLVFNQDIKPNPVQVDGRTLIPQADGSVKISCGTVIPSQDVDELFRQRQLAMKG